MDSAQIIIFLVIIVLAIVFVILGIQAFWVLKELKLTLSKTNKILDTAEKITDNISNPIATFSQVATGLKTGSIIASFLKKISSKDHQEKDKNGKQQ